jgi:hypothetical protein
LEAVVVSIGWLEVLEDRTLFSGDYAFAYQIGAPATRKAQMNDFANAVTVDKGGNTIMVGGFAGTVDFNPSSRRVFSMTSVGRTDIFVAKFAPDGSFLWARQAGGVGEDQATSVVTDRYGNIYIGGGFANEADFRPGKRLAVLTSRGDIDAFVWVLDAFGNFDNAIRAGGPGADAINSVALDPSRNLIISGFFNSIADFADQELATNGGQDAFVAKIDTKFNLVFAKNVGGISDDNGSGVITDAAGNIYQVGTFQSTADFDPNAGTTDIVSKGGQDGYLLKLSSTGNLVFAKQFGGPGADGAIAIGLDRVANILVAGNFAASADLDPGAGTSNFNSAGSSDVFVTKLDTGGNLVWASKAGGSGMDAVRGITIDKPGNVYLTGDFMGTADFDPGAGTFNLVGTTSVDSGFVWKLNAGGGFVYARAFTAASGFAQGTGIALAPTGDLFVSGLFAGTVDFDPGRRVRNFITSNTTSYDAFLVKLLA